MTALAGIPMRRAGVPVGVLAGLSLLVGALALASLAFGPVSITVPQMAEALAARLAGAEAANRGVDAILFDIRAPRVVLALAVGAGLGMAGAALQGLFRNPLADPGLIGVTAGATVGAVTAIVIGAAFVGELPAAIRPYALPLAAFIGSGLVTALIFAIAAKTGMRSLATLLLAGIAINAIAGAGVGALVYISDDRQLRDLTLWSMGSLGAADWSLTLVALVAALVAAFGLARLARSLDLLQLGDRAAFHAGTDVTRVKIRIAALSCLGVGAATAAAGPIGFVGLVGPHIGRLLVGPAHRMLLPAAALSGAALTLCADLVVRLAVPPAEPPIGMATSLIGGPFFLWLLIRRSGRDA